VVKTGSRLPISDAERGGDFGQRAEGEFAVCCRSSGGDRARPSLRPTRRRWCSTPHPPWPISSRSSISRRRCTWKSPWLTTVTTSPSPARPVERPRQCLTDRGNAHHWAKTRCRCVHPPGDGAVTVYSDGSSPSEARARASGPRASAFQPRSAGMAPAVQPIAVIHPRQALLEVWRQLDGMASTAREYMPNCSRGAAAAVVPASRAVSRRIPRPARSTGARDPVGRSRSVP
jgi:hypothetical protein